MERARASRIPGAPGRYSQLLTLIGNCFVPVLFQPRESQLAAYRMAGLEAAVLRAWL